MKWMIGRVFKELNLIEQWGSGVKRIISQCDQNGLAQPIFEELGHFFRVTIFQEKIRKAVLLSWQKTIIKHLESGKILNPKEAEKIWKVSDRTTRTRLNKMVQAGLLVEISTSPFDPQKTFTLPYMRTIGDYAFAGVSLDNLVISER